VIIGKITFESPIRAYASLLVGLALLLLAQEGKLSLDDPVSNYVPDVPNGDKITITELLNMRSGLYTYDDDPDFWAVLERDPTKSWSLAEVLAIAFKHQPYFPPGTDFHYSNTNYALLGLIAEKIEGKPLASCFQDRFFAPLGLKDTLLPASTSNTLPDPYSHGYLYGGCSFRLLTDKPYPPELQAAAKAGTLKPDDCTLQNSSYASAAGGVISTAKDCATWVRALVGGGVLNADYQRQWLDSVQPEVASKPEGQKYGYGISQFSWGPNTIYIHGGEMPWLQLENQLRPGQRHDTHRVDQFDCITRRPADRQYPLGKGARSDLRGVTASISAGAQIGRASNSQA
jgi:CubicO group peptidase (beta-lactamase class C family)